MCDQVPCGYLLSAASTVIRNTSSIWCTAKNGMKNNSFVAMEWRRRKEFSFTVFPWTKGNYMENMLNDIKLPLADMNLWPLVNQSYTLATAPRILMEHVLIREVLKWVKLYPVAHWNISMDQGNNSLYPWNHSMDPSAKIPYTIKVIPCTHGNNFMDPWKS